jgi:multiple sugar transport system substrate-binding protein
MRRRLLAAAVGLMSVLAAACGGGAGSATGGGGAQGRPVKLVILTHWGADTTKAFEPYIQEYERLHPDVQIQLQTVDFGQLLNKITAGQLSDNPPDIVHIYDLWLPQLVKDGVFARPPAGVAQDVQSNYAPGVVKAVSVQGTVYGYPTEVDTYQLVYNKALFRAAGIAQPPRTWDELVADAKRLAKTDASGRVQVQGFGIINGWDSGVVHPWLSMLLSDGGRLLSSDQKAAAFDDPLGLETLNLYKQLIDAKAVDPAMGKHIDNNMIWEKNFEAGKTGMMIMPNWVEGGLKADMKDRFADVGVAPIPVGPHGTKPVAVNYAWMFGVNAKSPHQAEAWAFLQWLNGPSGPGASSRMGDWLMKQGIIPGRTSDQQAHRAELSDPFVAPYVQALADSEPFPLVLGGAEITADIQRQIEGVQFGRAAPEAALHAAAQQVDDVLARFRR